MNCPSCGGNRLAIELDDSGNRLTCLACSTTFTQTLEVEPAAPTHAAPKASARTANLDVDAVALAKRQLKQLNAEIKRLTKLIQRRDALQRLVDAATQHPRAGRTAVVRALRANGENT